MGNVSVQPVILRRKIHGATKALCDPVALAELIEVQVQLPHGLRVLRRLQFRSVAVHGRGLESLHDGVCGPTLTLAAAYGTKMVAEVVTQLEQPGHNSTRPMIHAADPSVIVRVRR
jgi:hypothetical protein